MAKIKTGNNSKFSINKRQKIWICAHALDYDAYLEDVCRDLFRAWDCIVCYDEEPFAEYDKEELCSQLRETSLFVVLVTERFLTTENRAREVEFKFARDEGIPVLPIIQQPGLDNLFNEICGSYHALSAYSLDSDEYMKMLKKHLSSVLVNSTLAEEIRAEFDTYIFLSYRKVDKKDATKIISLIHSNDFCRDVAIWYDEFLVFGENFDDAIRYALGKSSLFVLAITPSVTDKTLKNGKEVDNYVVSCEFPTAKDLQKKILPIRVVDVPAEKLEKAFQSLPPCVNAKDKASVAKALRELLCDVIPQSVRNTPEHKFLIGLAYLNGIDVEIDRARALTLIEDSAKTGNVRAMSKLVHMYRNGDGVALNCKTAILWQKRLVEREGELYRKNPTLVNGEAYLNDAMRLAEYLTESGDSDEAISVCEAMIPVAEEYYQKTPFFYTRRFIAVAESAMAEMYCKKGKLDLALKHAEASLNIRRQNAKECEYDVSSEEDLAAVYSLLLTIYSKLGDDQNVNVCYHKLKTKMKNLQKSCASEIEMADRALQTIELKQQREKRKCLEEALDIFTKAAAREDSVENLRRVHRCYYALAELSGSEAHRFSTSSNTPDFLKRRFEESVEKHYGKGYKMPDKTTLLLEAEKYYTQAYDIAKRVAELTRTEADIRSLAKISSKIGDTLADVSFWTDADVLKRDILYYFNEAVKYLSSAITAFEELVRRSDMTEDYNDLVNSLQKRAWCFVDLVCRGR